MDYKLFLLAFGTVFLAELGDKTQLTALTLTASGNGGPGTVFLGASAALVCSTALAVLCGSLLSSYLNPKYIRLASAILFIVLGVVSLVQLSREKDGAEPLKSSESHMEHVSETDVTESVSSR